MKPYILEKNDIKKTKEYEKQYGGWRSIPRNPRIHKIIKDKLVINQTNMVIDDNNIHFNTKTRFILQELVNTAGEWIYTNNIVTQIEILRTK